MEETPGSNLSRIPPEQLVEFIKRQKLKIKKLEEENIKLETKLTAALATTPATVNVSAISSPQEPILFWELISRDSKFHQNLAKAAVTSLMMPFLRRISPKSCFMTWKSFNHNYKFIECEQKLEESVKNCSELEKRCLKLKGLLSRTHQANKQQAEDTNAIKRTQWEKTQELRNQAQEKLALIEEVRARDIESAFHQDLEIYIQKAAEGVVSQHQQLTLQLQSQSQNVAQRAMLKDIEDENARLQETIKELLSKEGDLAIRLNEATQQLAKTEKSSAVAQEKSHSVEEQLKLVESQLQDEKNIRNDLEVELDIMVRARADVLKLRSDALRLLETVKKEPVEKASQKAPRSKPIVVEPQDSVYLVDSSAVQVLNSESLKIRASDDFRVYVPPSLIKRPFKLQWSFELIHMNIGFAVLEQQEDGALPALIPYRRLAKTTGELEISGADRTIVVLFDNSFSWARSKELKCSIQVIADESSSSDDASALARNDVSMLGGDGDEWPEDGALARKLDFLTAGSLEDDLQSELATKM